MLYYDRIDVFESIALIREVHQKSALFLITGTFFTYFLGTFINFTPMKILFC